MTHPTRIPGNEKALETLDTAMMFLYLSVKEMIEGGCSIEEPWNRGRKTSSLKMIMFRSAAKDTISSRTPRGIDAPLGLSGLLFAQY
jgi:hypothetical protein